MSESAAQPSSVPARRAEKKVLANHLLNFTLPPRQRPPAAHPRKGKSAAYQPFNKERFVNAKYVYISLQNWIIM